MKSKQVLAVASVFVIALWVGGVLAWAQKSAVVDIPFTFIVGSTELPAGKYEIKPNESANGLVVRSVGKGETVNVQILTRISSRGESTAQVVFDKSDDKRYLAEVYLPGTDGFHLQGAPGKHTHTSIGVK
jgi:hypothetical protein